MTDMTHRPPPSDDAMRLSARAWIVLEQLSASSSSVATDQVVPATSGLPGADAALARGAGHRDHDLPAPDRARHPRAGPVASNEPVHVEALEAPLPVAREPLRLRRRLRGRPRRQHRARPVCRRRRGRLLHPGPLGLPDGPGGAGHARPVRRPRLGDHRPLDEAPAPGPVAHSPPLRAGGLDPVLDARPPGRHGQRRARPALRDDRRPRDRCRCLPLLGGQEGSPDLRHEPPGGRSSCLIRRWFLRPALEDRPT